MGVQKERKSTFLTAFEQREKVYIVEGRWLD